MAILKQDIRSLEKRYFRWLLAIVAANALVAAFLSASGTGWVLWEHSQENKLALMSQAQHVALVSLESGNEGIYQIDFGAIEDNLETTVNLVTGQASNLNICIFLDVLHQGGDQLIQFKSCSDSIVGPETMSNPVVHNSQLKLGSQPIANVKLMMALKPVAGTWVKSALGVALLVILSQIPIFVFINYNYLYLRLLKPLITSLEKANKSLKESLRGQDQEQKIRQSMMRLSSQLAKSKPQEAEKIYIAELHNLSVFPESIVLTRKKTYCQQNMQGVADALQQATQDYESKTGVGQQLLQIELFNESAADAVAINKGLPDFVSKQAYLLALRFTSKQPAIWFYLPTSEDSGTESFVNSYLTHLKGQYEDYQKFRENMIEETLESYRELTKKDGKLPVADDTVYVEYAHPNALIYDTKRKERKVRLSLSKLQQLFPDHLIQTSKAYLVNPKHIEPEDLDLEGKFLKVKMGRSKIRIPLSPVYLQALREALVQKTVLN